jgi:hypothetical protein
MLNEVRPDLNGQGTTDCETSELLSKEGCQGYPFDGKGLPKRHSGKGIQNCLSLGPRHIEILHSKKDVGLAVD